MGCNKCKMRLVVACAVGLLGGGALGVLGSYIFNRVTRGKDDEDIVEETEEVEIEDISSVEIENSESLSNDDPEEVDEEEFEHYVEKVETLYSKDGDIVEQVRHTEDGPELVTEPYVISVDSYENEYQDFSKNELTYYEEDDTLCDDRGDVIVAISHLIGDEALTSFGEGSEDENVVYVRNIELGSDFEITRDSRSYIEVELGVEPKDESYSKARKYFNLDEEEEGSD